MRMVFTSAMLAAAMVAGFSETAASAQQWQIQGTYGADEILVGVDSINPNYCFAEVNGQLTDYRAKNSFSTIRVDGLSGDDHIEIDETAGANVKQTLLVGGNGHDTIIGGYSRDVIYGLDGNDELFGNPGNDWIDGGNGDDSISGGTGVNLLIGGAGFNSIVRVVGVRVPAEWELQKAIWMQWPKGEEASYQPNFAGIIQILAQFQNVNIAIMNASAENQARQFLQRRGVNMNRIAFHQMPYDWSWMRDNGAIWVEQYSSDGTVELVAQDWGFDGWGGEGGPSRNDDRVPRRVAEIEGVSCEAIGVTLEKGTLEFNGLDTVIASWPVLTNRNPGKTRAQIEAAFRESFGVTRTVWLESASQYDLTNGHVDGIARFINANTVAVGRYADQSDPEARLYEESAQIIAQAGFKVVRVNIPGYIRYRGEDLEVNYMNWLVANNVVLMAGFGNANWDAAARKQVQALFPGRTVLSTDIRELWYNGGGVHCVTNDQPFFVKE